MNKLALIGFSVGASFAVACSGGPSSERSAEQAQAMCAIDSDICGTNGYPIGTGPKSSLPPQPVGACTDRPANVSYAQFGAATGYPVNGWAAPTDATEADVYAFQTYIVQKGWVASNAQPYFIAPASGGYSWIGFQLGPQDGVIDASKYSAAQADQTVSMYHDKPQSQGQARVSARVVECSDGYGVSTYWLVNDPTGCTKTSCTFGMTTHM